MCLCGQSVVCTGPGCQMCSTALLQQHILSTSFHHTVHRDAKISDILRRKPPDPCPLRASIAKRGHVRVSISTSSSRKAWAGPKKMHGSVVRSEEVIIEPQCLLRAAAAAAAAVRQKEKEKEREREWEREPARIHQAEPIDAQSLERGALEEAGGPQQRGASLVGGHQKKCFSLSDFQERAHFSLFPLTLCLMLNSSASPP